MKVLTTAGEIEFSDLDVSDSIELGDNHRKITTEYRHKGELVRSDVVVNFLRPFKTEAREGTING